MIDIAQEPSGFRCVWFAQTLRYSFRHSHFSALHQSLRSGFSAQRTLPYHAHSLAYNACLDIHSFGKMLEPRYVVGAPSLDQ